MNYFRVYLGVPIFYSRYRLLTAAGTPMNYFLINPFRLNELIYIIFFKKHPSL